MRRDNQFLLSFFDPLRMCFLHSVIVSHHIWRVTQISQPSQSKESRLTTAEEKGEAPLVQWGALNKTSCAFPSLNCWIKSNGLFETFLWLALASGDQSWIPQHRPVHSLFLSFSVPPTPNPPTQTEPSTTSAPVSIVTLSPTQAHHNQVNGMRVGVGGWRGKWERGLEKEWPRWEWLKKGKQ